MFLHCPNERGRIIVIPNSLQTQRVAGGGGAGSVAREQ